MLKDPVIFRGRGAQLNTHNRFLKQVYVQEHPEVIDEPLTLEQRTQYFEESPKKLINKVDSTDIPLPYSMNPYQGCEHGCIYCYARNTHEYWNFSAGLDFERKIIIKKNAAELLRDELMKGSWKPEPIMLSGNTDCYQPVERKLGITRSMLEVLLSFRQPVAIITKNNLVLRDLDLLSKMAKLKLVKVMISITTLDESLRQKLEPRTVTASERLRVIRDLSEAGIPTGVMNAPIIPGLNSSEVPAVLKAAAAAGAVTAGYTIVRLNGKVSELFSDWLDKNYPEKKLKILNHIREAHGGKLADSRFGTRMKGEGKMIESISQLFSNSVHKYFGKNNKYELDTSIFQRPGLVQMKLF